MDRANGLTFLRRVSFVCVGFINGIKNLINEFAVERIKFENT